jgi:hypothetical protein
VKSFENSDDLNRVQTEHLKFVERFTEKTRGEGGSSNPTATFRPHLSRLQHKTLSIGTS